MTHLRMVAIFLGWLGNSVGEVGVSDWEFAGTGLVGAVE